MHPNLNSNPRKFKIPFIYLCKSLKTQCLSLIITGHFQPALPGIVGTDYALAFMLFPGIAAVLTFPMATQGALFGVLNYLTVFFLTLQTSV